MTQKYEARWMVKDGDARGCARKIHAVPPSSKVALCSADPRDHRGWWSEPQPLEISCLRCQRWLRNQGNPWKEKLSAVVLATGTGDTVIHQIRAQRQYAYALVSVATSQTQDVANLEWRRTSQQFQDDLTELAKCERGSEPYLEQLAHVEGDSTWLASLRFPVVGEEELISWHTSHDACMRSKRRNRHLEQEGYKLVVRPMLQGAQATEALAEWRYMHAPAEAS